MNEKFPLALPEGTVLAGQYIIERVLGQGGFGITYEARDHKTGERVAVKEFFPDAMATRTNHMTVSAFSGDRGENFTYGKTCFLQEAETLAKFIGNENIVRIHSYFEENETAYFVMDFIEGTSFDEYLKQRGGRVPYEEAAQVLVPVMDALSAVHSKGIIHRDVTPDNIYITTEGVVKLLDFGAARYSLGDKSRSLDIILKHGFAPKEQYTRRGKQGPYTDIYALGATFYFALTGRRPPDSIERLDEDDLVLPSALGVQIGAQEEDAILKALSVQPADRFQSMTDFKSALGSSASQQPLAAVGSKSAVTQIYFNAPEETGGSGSDTAGAPAGGTEVQELAETMKEAGKLAGKMAGQMAGRMAEKTAETAGVVAGTAEKMSEMMAAKKAEATEKLAERMAAREAEKAAREAEKAARLAEKQAAAEAARQAAEEKARQEAEEKARRETEEAAARAAETPDMGTVGRTVGGDLDVPPNDPPAKPAKSKKPLFIAAGVAAVLLIAFLVFKPGGGSTPPAASRASAAVQTSSPKPTATPKPTDTPEPTATPEPTQRVTRTQSVQGNSAANLVNSGIYTVYDSVEYSVVNDGRSIYSSKEQKSIYTIQSEEMRIWDLMGADGKLYFMTGHRNMTVASDGMLPGGKLFAYNLKTGEEEDVEELFWYVPMRHVMMTEDYFFVAMATADGADDLARVSRTGGKDADAYVIGKTDERLGLGTTFTLSEDGWLYYTGRSKDNESGVYRIKANAQEGDKSKRLVYNSNSTVVFGNPIVAGDYLYVSAYNSANPDYRIIRMDREKGYVKDESISWNVSKQLDYEIPKDVFGFTVNVKNQEIYLYAGDGNGKTRLYRMIGHEDGTCELTLVYDNGFLPSLVYFQNGNYTIHYFTYQPVDGENWKHYYIRFDSEGNPITD